MFLSQRAQDYPDYPRSLTPSPPPPELLPLPQDILALEETQCFREVEVDRLHYLLYEEKVLFQIHQNNISIVNLI